MSIFGLQQTYNQQKDFTDYLFFHIVFLLSLQALLKALFTKSKRPGSISLISLGAIFAIFGASILVLALLNNVEFNSKGYVSCLGFIFFGTSISVYGFKKQKRRG